MEKRLAKKSVCKNGHKMTPDNTRIRPRKNGTINYECRQCNRERAAERRVRGLNGAYVPSAGRTAAKIRSGVFGKDCITLAEYKLYRGEN